MASFYSLFEGSQKEAGKDFWFSPTAHDEGNEIIKKGLEIRPDRSDGNTFWDDFLAVFGQNTEQASKFLEIPRDKISKWSTKVKKLVDIIRAENESDEEKKKKDHMLPTGNF